MDREDTKRVNRLVELCQFLLKRWPDKRIVSVHLYGSALGSRYRADSDLDVSVLDQAADRLPFDGQSLLMDQLERATGYPVDLRMLRDEAVSFQQHVLNRGTVIWIADKAALEEFTCDTREQSRKCSAGTATAWPATLRRLAHGLTIGT